MEGVDIIELEPEGRMFFYEQLAEKKKLAGLERGLLEKAINETGKKNKVAYFSELLKKNWRHAVRFRNRKNAYLELFPDLVYIGMYASLLKKSPSYMHLLLLIQNADSYAKLKADLLLKESGYRIEDIKQEELQAVGIALLGNIESRLASLN